MAETDWIFVRELTASLRPILSFYVKEMEKDFLFFQTKLFRIDKIQTRT